MYTDDERVVVTLDAGGTNLVFGAMKACRYITEPLRLPSCADDLDRCLDAMVSGFRTVISRLDRRPVAVSFAFPGPADYRHGIIGGFLPNFPSFRDGVALGPYLEERLGLPVYINNDGDLFAYGEAICGALPDINRRLAQAGSSRRCRNLLGYTIGTGFGIGIVIDGRLNLGDNSCVETFCLPHPDIPGVIVEDGVSVRAVCRVYGELSGQPDHTLTPRDICAIASGTLAGDVAAAREAFARLGHTAGLAIATAAQLIDAPVVIGGGIMAASRFIMPALLDAMRSELRTLSGETVRRVQMHVCDLDSPDGFDRFARGGARPLRVHGSDRTVTYDPDKRIGVTVSRLGASQAISAGAYAYALSRLDNP